MELSESVKEILSNIKILRLSNESSVADHFGHDLFVEITFKTYNKILVKNNSKWLFVMLSQTNCSIL